MSIRQIIVYNPVHSVNVRLYDPSGVFTETTIDGPNVGGGEVTRNKARARETVQKGVRGTSSRLVKW